MQVKGEKRMKVKARGAQETQLLLFLMLMHSVLGIPDPGSGSSSSSSSSSTSGSSSRKSHSRSSQQAIPVGIPGPAGHIPDHFTNGKGLPNTNFGKLDCEYAHGKCTRRMSCGIAFHDYKVMCKQELYGLSKNCSEMCTLSVISLSAIPEGHDYFNCDCGSNEYCKLIRQRTEPCHPRKSSKQEVLMCKQAELFCRADTVCNTSYDYYRRHCNDLIQGKTRVCSRQCNNTATLLWRQKAGHSFKTCTCEKGNIRCRKEREAVMKSCLGLSSYRASLSTSSSNHLTPAILSFLFLFPCISHLL